MACCPTLICVVHSTTSHFSPSLRQEATRCVSAFCTSLAAAGTEFVTPVTVVRADPVSGARVILHHRTPLTVHEALWEKREDEASRAERIEREVENNKDAAGSSTTAGFGVSVSELRRQIEEGLQTHTTITTSTAALPEDRWRCLSGALLLASTIFHRDGVARRHATAIEGEKTTEAVQVKVVDDDDDDEEEDHTTKGSNSALLGVGGHLPTPPPQRMLIVLSDHEEEGERGGDEDGSCPLSFVTESALAAAAVHLNQRQVVIHCFGSTFESLSAAGSPPPPPSSSPLLLRSPCARRMAAMSSSSGGVWGPANTHPAVWLYAFFSQRQGVPAVERRRRIAHRYVVLPTIASTLDEDIHEGEGGGGQRKKMVAEAREGEGLGLYWLCSECMMLMKPLSDGHEGVVDEGKDNRNTNTPRKIKCQYCESE